ncbi:MAG: endo-1,4-beta-xylanase [Chitinophagaceae bacterium]
MKPWVARFVLFVFAAVACVMLLQCSGPKKAVSGDNTGGAKGLKDYYRDYFTMGVAVSPQGLRRADESRLILAQFGSLTPENAMKMGPIHPRPNEYFWRDADSIAAFARRHGLKLRGHTLCWHNQTPRWLFTDSSAHPPREVTKEVLLQRLKDHITAVVTRYKGTVYAWDVVNEVISDSAGVYFRYSPWYRICGEAFVARAFEYAHAADPDALLFYNDYNETDPVKREKIYRLVKGLKEAGVPIHGIGLQAHWSIHDLTEEKVDAAIRRFAELGLKVQITELDISIQPGEGSPLRDSVWTFTPEVEKRQADLYDMVFRVFRKYGNVISGVTFWNVSDRYSWLDRRSPGKAYPLLFDTAYQPKQAYWRVVNIDGNLPAAAGTGKRGF